jgi:hypothetical protein
MRIDWYGIHLFVGAGVLIILGLNWGSTDDWKTPRVIVSLSVGVLLLLICLRWQGRLERSVRPSSSNQGYVDPEARQDPRKSSLARIEPLLPLEVFRSYNVCAVQCGSFVSGMVMLVMLYFVAIFMTIVQGESATKAGLQLIYFAPGMGGGSMVSMHLMKRFKQPRIPINLGGLVICVALGLISAAMKDNNEGAVNGFLAMVGAGVGLTFAPLALQARFSLSAERNAVVSSLTLFFRSLGGTVGLAQCAAVTNGKVSASLTHLVKSGALAASDVANLSVNSLSSLDSLNNLPAELQQDVRNAFSDGVRWSMISMIPWAGVAVIVTMFLSKIPAGDEAKSTQDSVIETGPAETPRSEACSDESKYAPSRPQLIISAPQI